MFVLVKVPTPVRTSGTSWIQNFSLSRTVADIYSDNVWKSRQCMTLHLNLTKSSESTAINLISIFASKKKLKWSLLHCTQVLKIKCAMESPPLPGKFVSYKHTKRERDSYLTDFVC